MKQPDCEVVFYDAVCMLSPGLFFGVLYLGLFGISPAGSSSSSDDDGESDSALSPNSAADSPLLGTFTQPQRTWWSYIIFLGLPTNPSECFLYPSTSPSRDRKPGVVWAWFGRGLGVVWAWFGRGLGVVITRKSSVVVHVKPFIRL